MGIFSKPEIIILKESNSAEEHLAKLEELLPRATGKVKENIQKEIILTKAGIDGEKKVLYELKNSNMDLVVLQDICIRTLVLRTAHRGANTGKQFYGCSSFPRCRYTKQRLL